jgi:uncharacterized protein (DUF4415 family)
VRRADFSDVEIVFVIFCSFKKMTIEFDPDKRGLTLEKRGLDVALAGKIFDGATLTIADERKDYGEARFITISRLQGRMVVLGGTPRGAVRRIISMRRPMSAKKPSTGDDWIDEDKAPDLSTPDYQAKLAAVAVRRGRPKADALKVSTTVRLDADIVAHFRAGGPGWQSRINAARRAALKR